MFGSSLINCLMKYSTPLHLYMCVVHVYVVAQPTDAQWYMVSVSPRLRCTCIKMDACDNIKDTSTAPSTHQRKIWLIKIIHYALIKDVQRRLGKSYYHNYCESVHVYKYSNNYIIHDTYLCSNIQSDCL